MAGGERETRTLEADPSDWPAKDRPSTQLADPDRPRVTGITEGADTGAGETCGIDLGLATETRTGERDGGPADRVLAEIERIRPTVGESSLGFGLSLVGQRIVYDDSRPDRYPPPAVTPRLR